MGCTFVIFILLITCVLPLTDLHGDFVMQPFHFTAENPYYEEGDLIIITQLSFDRLDDLEVMAGKWKGLISAAIFIARDVEMMIFEHMRSDSLYLTQFVDFHVMRLPEESEREGDFQYRPLQHYPVNHLRNLAWNGTLGYPSRFILHLDVDLLPSHNATELSRMVSCYSKMLLDRSVLVLPAFETSATFSNYSEMAEKKADLGMLLVTSRLIPFYARIMPQGHSPTDYKRWFREVKGYFVDYKYLYEPYIVMDKIDNPRFSELFMGRGFNKISHIYHLSALGIRFIVLESGWVVHNGPCNFPDMSEATEINLKNRDIFKAFKSTLLQEIAVKQVGKHASYQYRSIVLSCSDRPRMSWIYFFIWLLALSSLALFIISFREKRKDT